MWPLSRCCQFCQVLPLPSLVLRPEPRGAVGMGYAIVQWWERRAPQRKGRGSLCAAGPVL